jgi:hypothetical protein
VDWRYVGWAAALLVALGAWEFAFGYNAAAAFIAPFVAVVLLFLGLLGESPAGRVVHWMSDESAK